MNTLIEKLKNKDAESFILLYREIFPLCAKFILSNGGQKEDAEDIFQEALLVLLFKINEADFNLHVKISTYLYAIIIKMWRYRLRLKGTNSSNYSLEEISEDLPEIDESKLHNQSDYDLTLNILRSIDSSDKSVCQRILNSFYFESKSLSEIAEQEGFTLNYLKKKKANCLKYFRSLFENEKNKL